MITIKATMTTAAMATMETVEAAMITRAFCPALCIENPHRLDDPPVHPASASSPRVGERPFESRGLAVCRQPLPEVQTPAS